jgi:hypothetical protein
MGSQNQDLLGFRIALSFRFQISINARDFNTILESFTRELLLPHQKLVTQLYFCTDQNQFNQTRKNILVVKMFSWSTLQISYKLLFLRIPLVFFHKFKMMHKPLHYQCKFVSKKSFKFQFLFFHLLCLYKHRLFLWVEFLQFLDSFFQQLCMSKIHFKTFRKTLPRLLLLI